MNLTSASTLPVTVHYSTADGSGVNGAVTPVNYAAESGTLTFAPGVTQQTIMVPITTAGNQDEQFTIQLSDPTNAGIGVATGTATILNAHNAVSIGDVTVTENAQNHSAVFPITLATPNLGSTPITVHYTTVDGTALSTGLIAGFQSVSGTVSIAPGQSSATVSVPLDVNTYAMPDTQFSVVLSNSQNALLGTVTGTGTIHDPNSTPGVYLIPSTTSVNSGSVASFTPTLTKASSTAITVQYNTVDGTAISTGSHANYTASAGTITFAAGALTAAPIQIKTADASIAGPDTAFGINLHNPQGALLVGSSVSETIHNTATAPGISISNAQAVQGSSVSTMIFTIQLSSASSNPVTVVATPYQIGGLGAYAAIPNVDFKSLAQTITIPADQTSAQFSVNIASNSKFALDKSFEVVLSNPTNGAIVDGSAVGTIMNQGVSYSAHQVMWHDVDGDTVTLQVSKGVLNSNLFAFQQGTGALGGNLLQQLSLYGGGGEFAHANVSVTAIPTPIGPGGSAKLGNGLVNIGDITATSSPGNVLVDSQSYDLGVVSVQGDLAEVNAGDIFVNAGVSGLVVNSLGADPNGFFNGSAISTIVGPLNKVQVLGNLAGQLNVIGAEFGTIGNLNVGGALTGEVYFTGRLSHATIGQIDGSSGQPNSGVLYGDSSVVGGIGSLVVKGQILAGSGSGSQNGYVFASSIGSVDIGGISAGHSNGTVCGVIESAGSIGSVTVRGSIFGGGGTKASGGPVSTGDIVADNGSIGSVHVYGSIVGGSATDSGSIISASGMTQLTVDGSLTGGSGDHSGTIQAGALSKTSVTGSLNGGGGTYSGSILANGAIGSISIAGSLTGGAGANSGEIAAGNSTFGSTSGIAKIMVGGITGGVGSSSGSIQALSIGQLRDRSGRSVGSVSDVIKGGDGLSSGSVNVQHGLLGHAVIYGNIAGAKG